jgi:hypothetical protein
LPRVSGRCTGFSKNSLAHLFTIASILRIHDPKRSFVRGVGLRNGVLVKIGEVVLAITD